MLHADQVEIQQGGPFSVLRKAAALRFRQLEKVPHIGKVRQRVRVYAAVQILNIALQLIPHALEGVGQFADLVLGLVVQLHVVILGGQLAGGGGKPFQGAGDHPHDEQQQDGVEDRHQHRDRQDDFRHLRPGQVDFFHRRGNQQLHAVGQGEEGQLPFLPVGGIADHFRAAALPLQKLAVNGNVGLL